MLHETLISRIDDFLAREGIVDATFGWKVVKNKRLMERIRGGCDLKTATVAKIVKYLDAHESTKEAAE